MENVGEILGTNQAYAFHTLVYAFEYLSAPDLLSCSQVCTTWEWILRDHGFPWKDVPIYCCPDHLEAVSQRYDRYTRYIVIGEMGPGSFETFTNFCINSQPLWTIVFRGGIFHLNLLGEHQKNLRKLSAIINNLDTYRPYHTFLYLDVISNFRDLNHLELCVFDTLGNARFLFTLKYLRHLTLIGNYDRTVWYEIAELKKLQSLHVYGNGSNNDSLEVLFNESYIINLTELKELMLCDFHKLDQYNKNVMDGIKNMPNLKCLKLIRVSVTFETEHKFSDGLVQLKYLEKLQLEMVRDYHVEDVRENGRVIGRAYTPMRSTAKENLEALKGVVSLRKTLKKLDWFVDSPVEDLEGDNRLISFPKRELKEFLKIADIIDINYESCVVLQSTLLVPMTLYKKILERLMPDTSIAVEHNDPRGEDKKCFDCDTTVYTKPTGNSMYTYFNRLYRELFI